MCPEAADAQHSQLMLSVCVKPCAAAPLVGGVISTKSRVSASDTHAARVKGDIFSPTSTFLATSAQLRAKPGARAHDCQADVAPANVLVKNTLPGRSR